MSLPASPEDRPPAPPMPASAPCVLVTRPQPQADEWVARLQALGLGARALPLLAIADAADGAAVAAVWATVPAQQLVMFVSPSAVASFFRWRPLAAGASGGQGADGPPAAWPAGVWAGSTGPGTARALRDAGVPDAAVVTPPEDSAQFDAEALWRCLQTRRHWQEASVLVVRGEGGRDWLADTLRAAGATVAFVAAYRRTAPVLGVAQQQWLTEALQEPQAFAWLFSSSEAAGHLRQLAPGADWSRSRALATHPRIAAAAQALGFGQVQRIQPSPQAVADALGPFGPTGAR
ncbi:uroporphyrinogen-III synthase [Aquabacterium sp. OR-4]|uniref:uroporphyrinogen-III synthase n=1 Tax=Aquabacterium sp. OR-4 TaxID=2978127 RepID=UPI0028C93DB4|nr:uroporphyrinogen-III synthase [Aquabacterium sp. OR-4]MDT7835584.1 uroporphyrinogen-III synthase [Aquabacterium sp. OR-4]